MRHNKSTWDLKIKALKTYNIQVLWQQSFDLDIAFRVNSLAELEQSKELLLINSKSSTFFIPNSLQLFTFSFTKIDKKKSTDRSIERFD